MCGSHQCQFDEIRMVCAWKLTSLKKRVDNALKMKLIESRLVSGLWKKDEESITNGWASVH